MVYAALFTAMLTGSGSGGALSMASFGIGTLPGLIAATFGFHRLTAAARGGLGRVTAGFAIALFGVATVFLAHPAAALLCLTGTPPARVVPRVHPPLERLDRGQSSLATRALAFDPVPAVSGIRPNP
jgi:sulfite exporter TauE/SafE